MFRAIHSNGAYNASEIKQTVLDDHIQAKLRLLGDLELAILICLIAQEHCILSTDQGHNKVFEHALQQICFITFEVQAVIVECSANTTVEEFSEAILIDAPSSEEDPLRSEDQPKKGALLSEFRPATARSASRFGSNTLDTRRIADVVITTNLDLASESVQVQALELMKSQRIFTRTAMHTAPKNFMMLAIASQAGARFSLHLNDMFCMSHFHSSEEDELPHIGADISKDVMPRFSPDEIKTIRTLAEDARFTPEIAAYLHNVVVFMRNNRFIKGGVTATATRQLRAISKTLAPLHGLNYVPPSLVELAVRKIYPHRINLATVETERSLQWGSNPEAIRELLRGVTIEDAIEDALASVETPL